MRVYIAATTSQLADLASAKVCSFAEYLAPDQFEFPIETTEEEREDLVAQLAADDSAELNQGKSRIVIAADLNENQLTADKFQLNLDQIAAFLIGEEMAWYAPEEIKYELPRLVVS